MNYIQRFWENLKAQGKNLSIYFLAALIPMLLSLITNPFLAKNLSPDDYAIIGYYGAFNTLFSPLVNFYLIHYYTKRYFELNEDGRIELRATLFKALIYFSFLLAFVAIILIYLYTLWFNAKSQLPLWPYAILSTISLPLCGIYTLVLADYRMQRESHKFFKLSVINGILGVCLAVLLVVFVKLGAIGRMTASLLSALLIFIHLLYQNRRTFKIPFSWDIFKTALKFCYPLVIASMLTFFSSGYDKILLEQKGDIYALGIYSVGVTIAGYLSLFSTTVNDTFQPDIFESIVNRNYHRCLKYIVMKLGIMILCVIAFFILAPFIIDILTFGRYTAAAPYARIVAVSSITSMMYYSMSQVTVALGLTKITLLNKIIGSVVSIISFGLLIKYFGAIGAAWGIVLSYLYFFIGNFFLVVFNHKKASI